MYTCLWVVDPYRLYSVAAAIGTAIQYLAMMAFWFGGSDDEDSPLGGFGVLLLWLLARGRTGRKS